MKMYTLLICNSGRSPLTKLITKSNQWRYTNIFWCKKETTLRWDKSHCIHVAMYAFETLSGTRPIHIFLLILKLLTGFGYKLSGVMINGINLHMKIKVVKNSFILWRKIFKDIWFFPLSSDGFSYFVQKKMLFKNHRPSFINIRILAVFDYLSNDWWLRQIIIQMRFSLKVVIKVPMSSKYDI